jgi:hypothetical protein
VDYRAPIPPELLKKAGIQSVYVYIGMPLKSDPATGKRSLDEKIKPGLDNFFKLYGENGIKVLLVSNFYTRPPKGVECVDASGRTIAMGCFNSPDFLKSMSGEIRVMAEAFGGYPAFAGFLFDDGVQVRADCCYCDLCKRLYKEKYGMEPPAFEPDKGEARLDPKDPRLLWDEFHRAAFATYLRTQAEAATAVSDKLFLATIPSDSFYYGRHLNMDVAPSATSTKAEARIMRIERLQVRDWHIFQSFPFPLVVGKDAGVQAYGAGCHLTTPSPKIILHTDGPLIETAGRQQFLSPAEILRMMRTTIGEGANRICFWTNARVMADYADGFEAIGAVSADSGKVAPALQERKPLPARVGLLYSTVTEILQQPWRKNTLERWRHLHAFEAMAYALTRRSVQFRIIFDDELNAQTLAGLDVIILTGVTHLTKPVAEMLEKAVADGELKVLKDPASLPIQGAKPCEFDQDYWFNKQLRGYRQVRHLDHQAQEIWKMVLPELDLAKLQLVALSSESCFAKIFQGKDNSLLVFVINWDIENECKAMLNFQKPCIVREEASGQDLANGKALQLKVSPAGWRVLRCSPRR